MPIYEYECTVCGNKFEVRQNMNDEPIKICPECGEEVRKLLGTPLGIIKDRNPINPRCSDFQCGAESTCCGRQGSGSKRPCDD